MFDADNHYYEPDDCFTRYIEAEFLDRTFRVVRSGGGPGQVYVGERRAIYTSVTPADHTSPPGYLQGLMEGTNSQGFVVESEAINAHDFPAFMHREPRVRCMDEQGLEGAVLLPTFGVVVEHELRHDVALTYATLRAFNRWLEEEWGYGRDERIFAVPMLSLLDVGEAVRELERVLRQGARLVHLRPGPQNGRSPADPVYDPFWARVDEAGIPVVFHVSHSGYNDFFGAYWSERTQNPSHRQSPLQWALFQTERPVTDTLAALVLHNLFGRFGDVRVASIENGSDWVPHLLKVLDKSVRLGRSGPMLGGPLSDLPSDTFRAKISVCPFPEDDVVGLVDTIGATQVLFGSDYPHPEGIAEPRQFVKRLAGLAPDAVGQIMYSNTARLLGLPLESEVVLGTSQLATGQSVGPDR
jgi:predicted TIM-barrel fold metal-dependent hydrolase